MRCALTLMLLVISLLAVADAPSRLAPQPPTLALGWAAASADASSLTSLHYRPVHAEADARLPLAAR